MKGSMSALSFHGGDILAASDEHVVIQAAPGFDAWVRISIWTAIAMVPAVVVLTLHEGGKNVFAVDGDPIGLVIVLLSNAFSPAAWSNWALEFALQWSRMKPLVGTLELERTSTWLGIVARWNGSVVGPTRNAAVFDVNDWTGMKCLVLVVGSRVITLGHFIERKGRFYSDRTQWEDTVAALRQGTQRDVEDPRVRARPTGSTVPLVHALIRVLDQGPTLANHLRDDAAFARSLAGIALFFGCPGLRVAEAYWLEQHAGIFASLGSVAGGILFGGLVAFAELVVLRTIVRSLYLERFNNMADMLAALASHIQSRR
jgi:hypothetical protein